MSLRRSDRRQLRRMGCRCHPTIVELGGGRAVVRHEHGCPFGQQVRHRNIAGQVPVITVRTGRCGA
jgi:hypothetical protein